MPQASSTTHPEQEIIRRARIAGEQLDKEPGGRLGWLVHFAREGPAKTPGALESQGEQLLACALGPLPPNLVSFGPDPDAQRSTFTPADVRRFHRELRNWFHALVSYPGLVPGVAVPMKGYRMTLVRMTRPGVKPSIFAPSTGGPLRTKLFHRAAQWIIATDRLVACPECGRPVLALRRRLFCPAPAKCLQTHHDRKKIANRKNGGTT
jgi:hypothetical protein